MSKQKFEVGHTYEVDPVAIIAREDLRGRRKPVKPEAIKAFAEGMCQRPAGKQQIQPVQCRLTSDGTCDGLLELVFGFTRREAIMYAIENKLANHPTTIRVEIVEMTDAEAIATNVEENRKRHNTNAIDDAMNVTRLKAAGFTGVQIAEKMGCVSGWVTDLQKLLKLSDDHQQLIVDEKMTATDGIMLSKASRKKANDAVASAIDPNSGKVDHNRLVAALTADESGTGGSDGGDGEGDGDDSDGEEKSPSKRQKKQLNVKQIKEFFIENADAEDSPECWAEFCTEIVRFIDNEIVVKTFNKKIDEFLDNLKADAKKKLNQTAADVEE